MKRRLLLDSEVVDFLEQQPTTLRLAIWRRLREIAESPDRFEDFHEQASGGRELTGHIFRGCAILYWDDFADRHLKVLEITSADEFED